MAAVAVPRQSEDSYIDGDQIARKRNSDRRNSIVTRSLEFPGDQKRPRGKLEGDPVDEEMVHVPSNQELQTTGISMEGTVRLQSNPDQNSRRPGSSNVGTDQRRASLNEVQTQLLLELEKNQATIRDLLASQAREETLN
ncbi:hypothetical protein R1sor_004307 [Riccia sorocarpa]|uniref:Uncharacterized protein n=1 Tax=Riccia sorocarpa TaxID=122646 RepID=A0ABD3HKM6_9MARC